MRGKFITFEGFEGSGKSTHIKLLARFLRQKGYPVLVLREPGSTKAGELIRKILLNKKNKSIFARTELLLYLAARAQIVEEKIIPALRKGKIVLCDRFHDATVAYQGYGLGLDSRLIDIMGKFATYGVVPDLTLLLEIGIEEGLRRIGRNRDRIEQRSLNYHRRVREGYLKIAKQQPRRVKIVKVDKEIKTTQGQIRRIIAEFLCLSKI